LSGEQRWRESPQANNSFCFQKRGDHPHCVCCSFILLCSVLCRSADSEPRLCRSDTSRRHSHLNSIVNCFTDLFVAVAPSVLNKDFVFVFFFFFFFFFFFYLIKL